MEVADGINIMTSLPAQHSGFVQKRTWHKVRWAKNPHPEDSRWSGIEGKFDLFTDDDLAVYKDFVEIAETLQADKCATGASFGFGCTSEEKIDEWIRRNRKYSYADPEQAEGKAGKARPG